MSKATTEQLWWLLVDGVPTGPYTQVDLTTLVQEGRVLPDTNACPVGSTQWSPLRAWSAFQWAGRAAAGSEWVVEPPPIVMRPSRTPVPADALPEFARWLCIYSLFVSPTLWLLSNLFCIATPPLFVEESPFFGFEVLLNLADAVVGLVTTVLLFVGALQLRQLRRIGVTLLTAGLGINLGYVIMHLLLFTVLLAGAASDPEFQHLHPDDGNSAEVGFWLFLTALFLTALVFEVVAFIWLLRRGERMRLRG